MPTLQLLRKTVFAYDESVPFDAHDSFVAVQETQKFIRLLIFQKYLSDTPSKWTRETLSTTKTCDSEESGCAILW